MSDNKNEKTSLVAAVQSLTPEERSNLRNILLENQPADGEQPIIVSRGFSGPVPPPDMVREYENMVAGAADRFLTIAEQEQANRTIQVKGHRASMIYSFVIAVLLIGLALVAMLLDQFIPAIILGTSGLIAGVIRSIILSIIGK